MDVDTFLTTVYVLIDDYCKSTDATWPMRPGPRPGLSVSEVVTLAVIGQWACFGSERGFYRYVEQHWRAAFPKLPERSQFNRLQRQALPVIVRFNRCLVDRLQSTPSLYEALDGFGCAVRYATRRGSGWLAGYANKGYCNRLGWYVGFHVLTSVTPQGVITGFAMAPASTKDQPFAEDFLAARHFQCARVPEVGWPRSGVYVADNGFCGQQRRIQWREAYRAEVIAPPQRSRPDQLPGWSKPWRCWLAHVRQIAETVHDKLLHPFRLEHERPHDLQGFRVRLAAKVTLHHCCIWLNSQLGRPWLAFADLVAW